MLKQHEKEWTRFNILSCKINSNNSALINFCPLSMIDNRNKYVLTSKDV